MATFDQLPAEQRAIIELVLKRGQSYDDLAQMLDMPATRVRELAREALVDLTPATARRVEEDWRGQVADYVLGQQSGPEATATRGHLRRNEPARTWALSLLDALDPLYGNGTRPEIPEGEAAPRPRERRPATAGGERFSLRPQGGGRPLSPEAAAVVRRRRIVAAVAGLVVLLFVVLVWPIGLVTGGDDEGGDEQAQEQVRIVGNPILLRGVRGSDAEGSAVIAQRGDEQVIIVQATGLRPTPRDATEENPGFAYEVWLYNSRGDARSLGAQITDANGNLQGAAPLPADWRSYRYLDMSRENIDQNAEHSGRSVLRGRLSDINRPIEQQQGGSSGSGGSSGGSWGGGAQGRQQGQSGQ